MSDDIKPLKGHYSFRPYTAEEQAEYLLSRRRKLVAVLDKKIATPYSPAMKPKPYLTTKQIIVPEKSFDLALRSLREALERGEHINDAHPWSVRWKLVGMEGEFCMGRKNDDNGPNYTFEIEWLAEQ